MQYVASFICGVYFILLSYQASAQNQNLVPNPSFEFLTDCDLYFDEFNKTKNWKGYNFTPDLFNACSKLSYLGVPYNVFDRQNAATGKGYAGILTYHKDFQNELIGVELIEPLQKGTKYQVSFKVSRAKSHAQFATNNIGLLFTNSPEKTYNSKKVHINQSEVITESESWVTISGVFEADDSYRFLVIGNFFDKETTQRMRMDEGTFEAAYYFIDDVSVMKAGRDTKATVTKAESEIKKIENSAISIAGKIMDAETLKPIVAVVELVPNDRTPQSTYETDYISGQYAFANVIMPDKFSLKIAARNYYTITQKVQLKGEKRIKKDFYLHPLRAGQDIELDNITFKEGTAEIEPESFEELNKMIQVLRDNPTMKIQVSGFTNNKDQIELARKRAKAIKDYLENIGKIDGKRIQIQPYYETSPSRKSAGAADENRKVERMEFKILN